MIVFGINVKILKYFFFKDIIILMMDEIIVKKRYFEVFVFVLDVVSWSLGVLCIFFIGNNLNIWNNYFDLDWLNRGYYC